VGKNSGIRWRDTTLTVETIFKIGSEGSTKAHSHNFHGVQGFYISVHWFTHFFLSNGKPSRHPEHIGILGSYLPTNETFLLYFRIKVSSTTENTFPNLFTFTFNKKRPPCTPSVDRRPCESHWNEKFQWNPSGQTWLPQSCGERSGRPSATFVGIWYVSISCQRTGVQVSPFPTLKSFFSLKACPAFLIPFMTLWQCGTRGGEKGSQLWFPIHLFRPLASKLFFLWRRSLPHGNFDYTKLAHRN